MPTTIELVTEQALALSPAARAELADKLVESLDGGASAAVDAAWAKEAIRRLEEIRSGKVPAIDGETGFAQVRALLRK